MLADVVDLVNFAGIAENPPFAVAQDGAVFPAAFPELVAHLQILLGIVVAGVVLGLRGLAHVLGAAFEVGGDDVPADPALGQMVEGRQAPGEGIRVLERQRSREAEAQVLGDHGHGRDQLQRIVDRHLGGLANRRITVALIDVVDTQDIGDEQAIELAALENPGQIGPVLQVLVLPRTIARVSPEAGRLVPHTVHVKGIEANFTGHPGAP